MNHDEEAPSEGWRELAAAWKSSTTEEPGPDPALAWSSRERASRLARTVRWRNARELLAVALLVVVGLVEAVTARTPMLRLGHALMAAGALWVGAWLHRRGRNLSPPPLDATTSVHLAHESAQLSRQIELLGRVRTHYLLPFVPSVAVILASSFLGRWPHVGSTVAVAALVALLFVGVDALNRRAARRLRQQLAHLLPDPASLDGPHGDQGQRPAP